MYTTLAFLALLGAPYIYDISSLRVLTVRYIGTVFKLFHNEQLLVLLRYDPVSMGYSLQTFGGNVVTSWFWACKKMS